MSFFGLRTPRSINTRRGRSVKTLTTGFLKGAARVEDFPSSPFPEVAFIGRSNVGKSSLLNFIVLDRSAAKVSSTPGKTQQINFFPVESKWMFVDVPGFGYAKVAREERERWQKMVWDYLLKREQLRLVCVLVDSRHDPQPVDLQAIELLENNNRRYVIVLTKTDKISEADINDRMRQINDLVQHCRMCAGVIPFSVKSKQGRDQVLGTIKTHLQTQNKAVIAATSSVTRDTTPTEPVNAAEPDVSTNTAFEDDI